MKTKLTIRLVIVIMLMGMIGAAPSFAGSVYDTANEYWTFDEGAGTVAYNSGTTQNVGQTVDNQTLSSSSAWTAAGKINGAVDLWQNNTQYIATNSSAGAAAPTTSMSIAAWVSPESVTAGVHQCIFSVYGTQASPWSDIAFSLDGSTLEFARKIGNDYKIIHSNTTIQAGQWTLVVATYNNATGDYNLYINGQHDTATLNTTGTVQNTPNYFMTGYTYYPAPANYFKGSLDNLAIWNSVLSAADVTTMYSTGYVTGGVDSLGLSYTTDQLNQLAYLYAQQGSGTLSIDGVTWSYLSGTLPGDDNYAIGTGWTYGGDYYIKLGSGLKGETGGAAPEPATIISVLTVACGAMIRKMPKKSKAHQARRIS